MNDDRFAKHLDGLVTGKQSSNPDDLTAFASQVQGAHSTDENDRLDSDQRNSIWRELMAAHAHEARTTGGPGPLSQPAMTLPDAFNPLTPKRPWPQKKTTRLAIVQPYLQTAITIFALLAIIIAGFAGYTAIRDNRSPEITPTAFAAAPTQSAESMAFASPETESSEWATYISPEECDRLGWTSYLPNVNLFESSQDLPERLYLPLASPNPDDAEAAALAGRTHDACGRTGNEDSRETDRFQSEKDGSQWSQQDQQNRINIAREISDQFPMQDPAAFGFPTNELSEDHDPRNIGGTSTFIYHPGQAVELADGRIAIPWAEIFWEGDLERSYAGDRGVWPDWTYFTGFLTVFSNDSGTWMFDELLPFCVGECDDYWAELQSPLDASSTPAASPDSSPAAGMDWISWIEPEECVVDEMSNEEYADIMNTAPDIFGRSYDIVGPVNPDDSLKSAQVAQQLWLDACSIDQERSLQTEANIAYRSVTQANAPAQEAREQTRIQGELDLTNQFSDLQPADLFIILDEEAPAGIQEQWEQPTANDAPVAIPVFDPATAVELDDGRIAIPSSWIVWADDPNIQWINETERAEPFVYILKNVDGEWLADEESLWMCGRVQFLP